MFAVNLPLQLSFPPWLDKIAFEGWSWGHLGRAWYVDSDITQMLARVSILNCTGFWLMCTMTLHGSSSLSPELIAPRKKCWLVSLGERVTSPTTVRQTTAKCPFHLEHLALVVGHVPLDLWGRLPLEHGWCEGTLGRRKFLPRWEGPCLLAKDELHEITI